MTSKAVIHIIAIVAFACTTVTSYPSRSLFKYHGMSSADLNRFYRDVGSVSITMDNKIQCDQGRLVSVTQMKGRVYLGCSYFHPTEYYQVGVIHIFDADTLKVAAQPIELELPQDETMEELIGSSTNNVIYIITFSSGQPNKSIWTLSFPNEKDFEVNFFLMRPGQLMGLKVTTDGKVVLHEYEFITVFDSKGQQISQTLNPLFTQEQNPIDVLMLDNGNFLVSHNVGSDINKCDITEVTPAGKIVKSYGNTASKDSAKIGFASAMEMLDSGRLLLLNWVNDPDTSLEDNILVIRTDLSDGRKVISGKGYGIEEFGQSFSYSPTTGRLLVGFSYQAVVHGFKVST